MRFCFLGGYDPVYPRNAVIRKGLVRAGAAVDSCPSPGRLKAWARYPALAFKVARVWRSLRRDPDAVFFVPEFCQKDVPLAAALAVLARRRVVFDPLASRYETKILDWRRQPPGSLSAWWNFRIDRWAFRLSDLILADTSAHREYYRRTFGVPADKIEVVPVGCDDDLFRPAPAAPPGPGRPFTVLFYGSFLPLHGADVVVRAARIVADKDPAVRFQLIGSGQTFAAVRAEAERLGLGQVEFPGWVAMGALPARIAAADLCLGIFGRTAKAARVVPHKVYQSLAMRKPLITLRTPAALEFFRHREHLFLCDAPEPGALAEAILELLRDGALREKIADGGCALVRERFRPEAIGRLLAGIVVQTRGSS
jgi:glycosyltransferase involved in cell wall biosynthesis